MESATTAISKHARAVSSGHLRLLLELAVGYALILIVIWTPRPWQRILYFVAAAFIIVATRVSFPGVKAMGLSPRNFFRSAWVVAAALLTAAISITVAYKMHSLHGPTTPSMFLKRYAGYMIFACVQQALLQDFFLLRLLRIMRSPQTAAVAAAAIFSLAHLPNPILMVVTFIWGLTACLLFLRYRNLYVLAVAHAILGVTLPMSVPGPVIRNMRVGLGYLTYNPHHLHLRGQ
ncbi:MAG: CPBP family intramembrane metalloprotease [Acidobacteriota bacterium]|nr:CPBP family intramembrane metalloprotease [Acidobacteriota bacterium]